VLHIIVDDDDGQFHYLTWLLFDFKSTNHDVNAKIKG